MMREMGIKIMLPVVSLKLKPPVKKNDNVERLTFI